jgi:hypothetical protein
MKKFWQSIIITSLTFLMLQPVVASAEEVSLAEYQDLMLRFSIIMGAEDLTAQLAALTYEEWQQLYDATPSKGDLPKAITDLEKLAQDAAAKSGIYAEGPMTPQAIDPSIAVAGEFEPRYPDLSTSGSYWLYIYPSIYLFLPDGDEAGFQDDRCNEHAEAIARGAHIVAHGLAIAAQVTCDASPDIVSIGTCALSGTAWGVDFAAEEILVACEVQTGNVDSAEIEAAYENTRTILDEANYMSTILDDETNFTDDDELAAHESAIKNTMSSQHRALNKKLTEIKNQLDQQQAQLDEIIRLLNTPQGKRPSWNK